MEGLLTTVVEAMSVGSCVITTRGIGNEELIEDGKTGVLVNANDVQSLHEAIENLISDSSLRDKIGKEAMMYVVENHSWKRIGLLLNQMLTEIVETLK